MGRYFITGSSDGLGLLTAKRLIASGHSVVLHARTDERARQTEVAAPGAEAVLVADLTSIEEVKHLAAEADKLGPYDAIIHNAGLFIGWENVPGKSGLPSLFAVNVLAPYILAALIQKPKRFIVITSSGHTAEIPPWERLTEASYGESKLEVVLLAFALARRWPDVQANALDPGWVPTKMGGEKAPGDINETLALYEAMALGTGVAEGVTGQYLAARSEDKPADMCFNVDAQERLLDELKRISGVSIHGRE